MAASPLWSAGVLIEALQESGWVNGRRLNNQGAEARRSSHVADRKDGAYGSATMRGGASFAVHDGTEARQEKCAALYE